MNQLIRKVRNSRSCNRLRHRMAELNDCPTFRHRILWGIIAIFLLNPITGFTYLEPQTVVSDSMMPELKEGDHVMVEKYEFWVFPVLRDNIIAFHPTNYRLKPEVGGTLINRVIGLPREKVQIKGGEIYINDHLLKQEKTVAKPNYAWGPQVIPPNSYFVLGDNRSSINGRHNWEIVRQDRIIGQAVFRFWPLNQGSHITEWGPTKGFCESEMHGLFFSTATTCDYDKKLMPNFGV